MIISVRGANGAGKSHLVRTVFQQYAIGGGVKILYPKPPKRRPFGMIFRRGERRLFVPGHYEIANGGVDTLDSLRTAYDLVWKHHEMGCDVLYEGKNMSDNTKQLINLKQEYDWDCRVVLLDVPLEKCVESVRARGHGIKITNIMKIHANCERDYGKFQEAGLTCRKLGRDEATREVLEWLTSEK